MAWKSLLVALAVALATPTAWAGTRDDPEVRDAANDTTRYPGVPTVEPTVDILGIWFSEDETSMFVSLEVAQIGSSTPDVPNISSTESYSVNVFVDGENAGDERCSSWGDFGVRWDSGSTADLAYGWHYDGDACPAEQEPVQFTVEDNVITWTVPKSSLSMIASGSVLTLARADAWSGDTWPATPDDRADDLPGRPYAVQSGPAAGPQTATDEDQQDAVAVPADDVPDNATAREDGDMRDIPAASLGLALVAVAAALGRRRRR